MKSPFVKGVLDGVPIALGYLSVSFGFGILAVRSGLTTLTSVIISAVNLTSAGQAAGIAIIAAGGSYIEMALTQLIINLRYGLMSISLSQKLDSTFNTPRRLLVAYGITDEIFAVVYLLGVELEAGYLRRRLGTEGTADGALYVRADFNLDPGMVHGNLPRRVSGSAASRVAHQCNGNRAVRHVYCHRDSSRQKEQRRAGGGGDGSHLQHDLQIPAAAGDGRICDHLQRDHRCGDRSAGLSCRRRRKDGGRGSMNIVMYIAVMACVTYLIRMIPFAAFRKQIKSRFFRSFLYYVPYAVLTAMTIPAIFYSTGSMTTAAFGTAVAVILAYFDMPLIVVALAASAAAFAAGFFMQFFA